MSASYNWTFNDNLVDPTGLDLWQCQCAATVSGTATLDGVSGFQLNAQAELSAAPLQISDIANHVIGGNGWDYYCVADSPSECPSGPSYPLGVTYLGSLGGAATVDSNGYLDFTVYVVGVPYTLSIYI
jgi:hypothetical protein